MARGHGGAGTRWGAVDRSPVSEDYWGRPGEGRHALDEDALLTPIFHAMKRGAWRTRQHEAAAPAQAPADPVVAFHRDPLAAPIPAQAYTPASVHELARRRRSGAHAMPEPRSGRHHRVVVPSRF